MIQFPKYLKNLKLSNLSRATFSEVQQPRPPVPPFTKESAAKKVRLAENGWNTRNPAQVSLAYSPNSVWRNRDTFIQGRDEIKQFLTEKWQKEQNYRLIKELFAYTENRIAVRYAYEYQNKEGKWFRAYGNENWEFDENGYMTNRYASINDVPITEEQRKFHWEQGIRPDDHPELSDLGL